MSSARLHDGALLEVSVLGSGPAVLLPVRTAPLDAETAEQMRAWGADPDLGRTLATGLADAGFQAIAADYEGHVMEKPKPHTLTPEALAGDLLAIADAAGADRLAYYGYSWLALAGLQLAIRTDRLTGLAMGGFPPLGGPYAPMLAVTYAAHRMAVANRDDPPSAREVTPGDWEASEITQPPELTGQFVTLYEALQDFDERAALERLTMPRLAFCGDKDDITYGPKWGDVRVPLGEALIEHRDELTRLGWTVDIVADADHLGAMQAAEILPRLTAWLQAP